MKSWIRQRQEWINANIDQELYHIYDTVTYMTDGEVFRMQEVPHGYPLNDSPQAPYKEGYVFSHWADENGNTAERRESILSTRRKSGQTSTASLPNLFMNCIPKIRSTRRSAGAVPIRTSQKSTKTGRSV